MAQSNLAVVPDTEPDLLSILDRASSALANARTFAEIVEAKEQASFVKDVAKRTARIAIHKGACDEMVSFAFRMKADALAIEHRAACRLADEYDAAQSRGEIAKPGEAGRAKILNQNFGAASPSEAGLSNKAIFEARQIRDAEKADPGIVQRTLDEQIERGEEPTNAAIKQAIVNRTSFTGNNQWFTPAAYLNLAREVMGGLDLDPASHEIAQQSVKASKFYTEEENSLTKAA